MNLTEHFTNEEFRCKCGCNGIVSNMEFARKLERLRCAINKPVIVVSGYRCSNHDKAVGGSGNGTHTRGIAADIRVDGLTSWDIAEQAEKLGFTGIGIINDTNCHVDIRNKYNYVNEHWFGNEMTGEDNIKTFIRDIVSRETYTTTIELNGKKYKLILEEI